MTNNYNVIYDYMKNLGIVQTKDDALKTDLFFDVQLIRRGKDHPSLPSANYTFKTYYFDSLESFEKSYEEIKTCCNIFKLRAYVSVNAKSKQESTKKVLEKYAHDIVISDYRKPWKDFSSICGGLNGKDKRWIVDLDDITTDNKLLEEYIRIINMCDGGYDTNVVCSIPTKSGVHVITHPFNLKQFNDLCTYNEYNVPDIQKNHLTLLYENL